MMITGKEAVKDQRTTIERLLNDEQVLVHVNPQRPGVLLPEHLADNRTVTLRLSRYFKGELVTDEERVTAELLFGSQYCTCVLPWDCIWGASSITGEEFVWASAAPEEIMHMVMSHHSSTQSPSRQRRPHGKSRAAASHLRRVK
jgi:hypothetical protein